MFDDFSDAARRVLSLAEQEARKLQHEYVGTEHILLGLVDEESGAVANELQKFGLDVAKIRGEIDQLVQRGPQPVSAARLPLTPRSKRVFEYATAESRLMDEKSVGPEHLLLGLFREPDGVAGQVLRNLGLELKQLVAETFKIRVLQMKTVERAVRPVRAGIVWKRKTREELLAHLSAIYEEEQSRRHDPVAAMHAASERFGAPEELSRELESALTASERRAYFFEKIFGWRAPESAARFMFRQARLSFVVLALAASIIALGMVLLAGWSGSGWSFVRTSVAFVVLTPLAQFSLGVSYYKLRDALYGPIWARKSHAAVMAFAALTVLATFVGGVGFIGLATWDANRVVESFLPMSVIALAMAIAEFTLARARGPIEIRDTLWACMQLDT